MIKLKLPISRNLFIAALLITFLAVIPLIITQRYFLGQIIMLMIWASVAVQWNVLIGHAGVFSLAQMLIFATGAYGLAMMNTYLDISPWLAMPIAAVFAAIFALFIGLACLRLGTAYVALLTFAIAFMVFVLIITESTCYTNVGGGCQRFFGGTTGFSRLDDLGFRKLLKGQWMTGNFYVVLSVFALSLISSIYVIHGRLGLAFLALSDSRTYAISRGLDRTKFQLLAFVITAFFTGLTGAVYAAHFKSAGPSLFDFSPMMLILAMVIVGGLKSTWGPIIGAVVMMSVVELAKEYGDIRNTIVGLVLVVFIVLLPSGFASLKLNSITRFRRPK